MKISTSKLRRWEDFQETTHEHILFHLKDHWQISLHFKADFSAFEANLKQIEKCYRFFETNWNEFIKKDEKLSEFASKFEVNLKWIWKEFEENSSLNKLRAQCRSGAQGKNKGRLIFNLHRFCLVKKKTTLQISSRLGKIMTNLKWIPNTIVTRIFLTFW